MMFSMNPLHVDAVVRDDAGLPPSRSAHQHSLTLIDLIDLRPLTRGTFHPRHIKPRNIQSAAH
jgi:hypothetical protein